MSNQNTMRKIRIIIAEDFEIIRNDFVEKINRQPDMEIVGAAGSKQEVLELFYKTECDMVLMDVEMEKINSGIEAAEQILSTNPEQRIIFLTIHETDDLIFSALSTGSVDYIVKSEPFETLAEHIRNMYAGNLILAPQIQDRFRYEFSRLRRSEQSLLYFINKISSLTPAEKDLIRLLLKGKKIAEIAKIRSVEVVTVKTQIQGLLKKFDCKRTKDIIALIKCLDLEKLFLNELS